MDVTEKIETKTANIWIDNEGVLHLKIKDGAKIDAQELKTIFSAYKKLGCDTNKRLQLIEGSNYFTLDRKLVDKANKERHKYIIAAATVNNSLSLLLLFRFIHKFHKLTSPIEIFRTKEAALEWLRSFKEVEKS